jgi:phenylpyruvate tautomerase PptA (4-oxalocrotonate tautomerase family)
LKTSQSSIKSLHRVNFADLSDSKIGKNMKPSIKATILLSIFFIITACYILTPSPAPTTSHSIQDEVMPTQITDEEAIRSVLAAHLGTNASDLTIVLDQNTGAHARGEVENGYFLAAKVDSEWQIIADGQAMPDCEVVTSYGFPASMVPDCQGSSSDVNAIKDALAEHLGVNLDGITIIIEEYTGTHARGGVENGYFIAAKVNGEWQIVADGQAMPDCQVVAQYNFPLWMVPECSSPPSPPSDEDAIRAALAAHLGANASDLTIVIDQNTGSYARGGVDNGYFLAAKVDGEWQIIADGQAMPDCTRVAQSGFPPSMVPECQGANTINEIHFKPGGTFAYIQKSIRAGEQHSYKIQAVANQTMIVSVSSDQNDVFLGINGIQGGQQLLSTSAHTPYWTGTLPQTQDYAITLTTNNPDTKYFLNVEIPANIRFEPGTYSTVVDGHIEVLDPTAYASVDNIVTYLLYASAGQTMDVQLSSPHLEALSLGVYGKEDGQPYQRWQVKNHGYYGALPLTQGYYLKVFSNGASTDFTLTITIN